MRRKKLTAKARDEQRLREENAKKPKQQKKRKKRSVPKTVQKSLPYQLMMECGIIRINENHFSKTYRFDDVNYSIAKQEEQEAIFLGYCSVLNSFDTSADIQITVYNNHINKAKFNEMVLLKAKGNGFDRYIDVYNDMLIEKMEQGQNGIVRSKFLTVTIQAANAEAARIKFMSIDVEIINVFKKIGSAIVPLTANDRVSLLKDIFRGVDIEIPELHEKDFRRKADRAYCCPDYLEFKKDYFLWGDKYARTMFIKDMPASLKDCLLTDILGTNLDVMVTVNVAPVDPYKALKIVQHQLTSMQANKLQAEKKALQSGYTADVINQELKHSLQEAEELLDDLRSKNQKMFLDNIIIMVTAADMDELNANIETIEAVVRKHICSLSTLHYQQEKGLQSVLPIGNCTLKIRRTLTTESTAVLLPFSAKEISQKNGMYYGLNALSNNMILFSRLNLKNPNGFILGSPGSGKSFAAKREMLNVFLATDDDIIIIDPESEYASLVAALNGETIYVSPASGNHINPLDMTKDYSDDESPLTMKSDFILSFCECLVGRQGLSAKERGIIDRCLTMTYGEYLQTFDSEKTPTLMDFYENLKAQPEQEAQGLALSFELYIKGNLNMFAHRTNVDTSNRVVSYDIKDLGKQLKTLGMLIVLDYVWNRITMNRAKGKRTWIYMDEIYLLFANEYSANFLFELYKRARKWGGVPTGITQNVEDLLKSETARSMLSNTDFIMMLNQATSDREQLAKLLNISDNLLTFVINSDSGQGLICYGGSIIPFKDKFPHNELYDLMTTKLEEVS
ncbi:MAG TPA: conjugal transfer protein [Ruminococcus sp.]|nr:conjugal transfer protein [Ruminococcus sp.]